MKTKRSAELETPLRGPNTPRAEETALAASELRYRRLFESAKDGILILDADTGMVVDVNPYLIKLLGYTHAEFIGKAIWELGAFRDIVANEAKFLDLQQHEYVRYEDLPLETVDGHRRDVEFISNVYLVDHKKVIQCNVRDITARKRAGDYRDMSRDILQILNAPGDFKTAMAHVLDTLKAKTGVDAVGLRLHDGEDFPYFAQQGFSLNFLQTENSLIERDANGGVCRDKNGRVCLECTCGLVLSGNTDPTQPFFTKGGSFWINDSFSLLDLPAAEDPRRHPRNECIHQGYASVALVPIREKARIVGLLHLNDRRKGCFTLELVEILEGTAAHIGAALLRKQTEQALLIQMEELKRWHDVMLGREGRVIELKKEVNALLAKADLPPRYPDFNE